MATTYDINYFIFEIDITEDNTVIQLKNNRRGDTTEWDNITYWGDGTSDTNTTHTYNIGKYTIKSKLFTYRDNKSGVNSNRYVTNVFSINKNITDCYRLFYDCNKLTSLDVSNFDTSNVTNMYAMFSNCLSLISLDVSNFNTSNVTNMRSMFNSCRLLTSLDLSSFNTSNVTNMDSMFYGCNKLTSLDLSNFTINDTVNTDKMFHDTPQLQDIGMVYCTKATIEKVSLLIQHTANIYVNSIIPENCTPVEGITFIYDGNIKEMTHEPLRAVGDAKDRYVLIDGNWYIERKCGIRAYQEGDKDNYKTDLVNTVYPLETPQYEPINYNPLETYADITHITTNSAIPCNITVKNHGYNCLLKPSTTYTVSSNLGLNTVTTPAQLTEDCLRFMDTDTSDVTTMKDVLVLKGDWTTKANLIPANFSGIESCFEQEYDAEKGKYKVNVKVVGKNLYNGTISKGYLNWNTGEVILHDQCGTTSYIKLAKNKVYTVSTNHSKIYPYSVVQYDENKNIISAKSLVDNANKFTTSGNCSYVRISFMPTVWDSSVSVLNNLTNLQIEEGDTATTYEPYKESNITFYLNEPLRGVEGVKDRVFIKDDKVVVERNCSSYTFDGSEQFGGFTISDTGVPYAYTFALTDKKTGKDNYMFCDRLKCFRSYAFNTPMAINGDINTAIYIMLNKSIKTLQGFKQWLQANPITVVYQLAEPVYEEVEYNDTKLFIESFKNSTLSYNSNVSVTSTVHYSYSVPIVDTVAQTADISDEQDQLIIDLATQCAVMEMMLM